MKPWELYEYQKNLDYKTNTLDYDWRVKVENEEKTIYVFSQFSTSTLDWIVNFLFFFIPQIRRWYVYFACLGWQTAFNSCKGLMMNEVMSAMNLFPGYKVVCCGHSYGGAGSVLVGIEIFFQTGIRPDLITFGAPKPLVFLFTKLITRLFFNKVVQYAHKSDIVTYMPPLPGYWNVRVVRIGKFNLKDLLFNAAEMHTSYGDKSLYEGKE
jgi:hypothetical protein